uniref:Uncharacterized protein n=1 Tax=Cacopsylla melanoneura TaxID=428564 RepID=A0A8D8Q0C6_9HEMI
MAHFGRGLRVHFGGHVYDKRLQIERALPVLTAHAVELGIPESGGLHQRLFQILGGLLADCGVVHGSLPINQFLCLVYESYLPLCLSISSFACFSRMNFFTSSYFSGKSTNMMSIMSALCTAVNPSSIMDSLTSPLSQI